MAFGDNPLSDDFRVRPGWPFGLPAGSVTFGNAALPPGAAAPVRLASLDATGPGAGGPTPGATGAPGTPGGGSGGPPANPPATQPAGAGGGPPPQTPPNPAPNQGQVGQNQPLSLIAPLAGQTPYGAGRRPEILTPLAGATDPRTPAAPTAPAAPTPAPGATTGPGTTTISPRGEPAPTAASTLKGALEDKDFMGGLGKIAGGLAGGGGGGAGQGLDMSLTPISGYDPGSQMRAGAAKLFADLLAKRQAPPLAGPAPLLQKRM